MREGRARYLSGSGLDSITAQQGRRSLIKSIQRGTISITGAATNTATIVSVDMNNSVLRFLNQSYNNTAGNTNTVLGRLTFTNSTTITATLDTADGGDLAKFSFEVLEYNPGVIKSIQRDVITVSSAGVAKTITAVDTTKSVVDWLGITDSAASPTAGSQDGYVVLTNSTTVTGFQGFSNSGICGFQVVEFF